MSEPTSRHELFYRTFRKSWQPRSVPNWEQLTFDEQTRWVAFYNTVELWLTGKKKCPILDVQGLDPWTTVNVTKRVNELQLAYNGLPACPGPRTGGSGVFSSFLNLPGDLEEEVALMEREEKAAKERIERIAGKLDLPVKRVFPDDPEDQWDPEARRYVSVGEVFPEEDFVPYEVESTAYGNLYSSSWAEDEAIIKQAARIVEKYDHDEEEVEDGADESDQELSEEEAFSLVTHLPDPYVPLPLRIKNRIVAQLWKWVS